MLLLLINLVNLHVRRATSTLMESAWPAIPLVQRVHLQDLAIASHATDPSTWILLVLVPNLARTATFQGPRTNVNNVAHLASHAILRLPTV